MKKSSQSPRRWSGEQPESLPASSSCTPDSYPRLGSQRHCPGPVKRSSLSLVFTESRSPSPGKRVHTDVRTRWVQSGVRQSEHAWQNGMVLDDVITIGTSVLFSLSKSFSSSLLFIHTRLYRSACQDGQSQWPCRYPHNIKLHLWKVFISVQL